MARPLRIQIAGAVYHVTGNANGGAMLFADDLDRRSFLARYRSVIEDLGWRSLAYCLMGTHYHLLFQTPNADLADGMRNLNGPFAQQWRKRRGNHGSVLADRYFAKLVQRENYLVQAARYIALNPVAAGLCKDPGEWRWSSYNATCTGVDTPVLHASDLLKFFTNPGDSAAEGYRAFVAEKSFPEYDVRDTGLLGDDIFARDHVPPELPSPAIPRRFLEPRRPPLHRLLSSGPREQAAALAHLEHGYYLKDIAAALGVSTSTVCRWVKRRASGWT
jgi:REP-associated tyrosine transposase